MLVVLLGIALSFSRIAQVATMVCLIGYVVFQYRNQPKRLLLMVVAVLGVTILALVAATLAPSRVQQEVPRSA